VIGGDDRSADDEPDGDAEIGSAARGDSAATRGTARGADLRLDEGRGLLSNVEPDRSPEAVGSPASLRAARGPLLDAAGVERRTGWRVVAIGSTTSTNDEAVALRDRRTGGCDRMVVVADEQTAGRGRGGHTFASPAGGLYASLLVTAPSADLPAPLVFATAVALAEAVEETTGASCQLKWPNDVWIEGKKVAGVLVEASPAADPGRVVAIVGVGVNVAGVPATLPPGVAAATTAVDLHARAPVSREALLVAFLWAFDARRATLSDLVGRRSLEADYRRRLALVGERVRFLVGDAPHEGVLRDVSLERGLLVESTTGFRSFRAAEHVRELRRAEGDANAPSVIPR